MKKLLSFTSVFMLTFAVLGMSNVQALGSWQIKIAAPDGSINSRKFNIEFTTLSTDPGDVMDVQLFQNGVSVDTETTTKPYGDSGDFSVTVPNDGVYQFFVRGTNGPQTKDSPIKVVRVDTVATSSPGFGQVTRNGNTYTVTFSVPNDSDAVEARLFSSTSNNFTANANTQVGRIAVSPGQIASISYTAPDSAQRFHAVQIFDNAGNGSVPTGDSNVVVAQGLGQANGGINNANAINQAGVAGGDTDEQANNDGVTQGSSDEDRGQVDADGNSSDTSGEVSGDSDSNDNSDSIIAWAIIIGAVLLILGYSNREKIAGMFKRNK